MPQQGFPQQGFPQQGFPQQGAPGGFRPAAPPPPKGGSSAKIIGIVVGALVVLGLVAGLIAVVSNRNKPLQDPGGAVPTPTVNMPTPATTVRPTTSSTATTVKPSASATAGGTTTTAAPTPAGAAITVGQGLAVTPREGWTVVKQEADFLVLGKGGAFFMTETGKTAPGTTGTQLVDSYLASQAKQLTNVKKGTTSTVDVDPSLSVAKGLQVGTATGANGSSTLGFGAVASIRTADGVAFVGTLVWPAAEDVATYNADYTAMVSSLLAAQLKK